MVRDISGLTGVIDEIVRLISSRLGLLALNCSRSLMSQMTHSSNHSVSLCCLTQVFYKNQFKARDVSSYLCMNKTVSRSILSSFAISSTVNPGSKKFMASPFLCWMNSRNASMFSLCRRDSRQI